MRAHTGRSFAAGFAVAVLLCHASALLLAQKRPQHSTAQSSPGVAKPPSQLPCGDVLSFQVLLDRQGFSPGVIDGRAGANSSRAISAWQRTRQLERAGARET